ncbi:MAG: TrkH family potassium uptake protein [Rhodobacteraceae bacterium]|nr:TrkH family potassium uptake protein [Paracoccaceae bacterium]
MFDFRPVGYVIGLLLVALGATMLIPWAVDIAWDTGGGGTFAVSAAITILFGGSLALASANSRTPGLNLQQAFLLTVMSWLALPVFAALPFWFGAPQATYTDAFFEAMSGMTTTGSTVFSNLDELPMGTLLWRGMMQWFGGVGIIVVAMAFLPTLKVGGMQLFRSEGFDTLGKVLPRAGEIAGSISIIYLVLTVACILAYTLVGMEFFDALVLSLTTISTGGFTNTDASFGAFQGAPEYVASMFMLLASLPFIRYVQMMRGSSQPLFRDSQVRAFLVTALSLILLMTFYRMLYNGEGSEESFREALFNVTSILSGTGYISVDYQLWGPFPVVLFFMLGLVGGCAGSTCCSIKIFRFQLLFISIKQQIKRIHSPHGIFAARYAGRPVGDDVMSSVMAFFVMFMLTLGVLSVILTLLGLDFITAVSGAATALANVGPGLGPEIGPSGNFGGLSDPVKWVLSAAMLLGRLELISVYILFTVGFWRG